MRLEDQRIQKQEMQGPDNSIALHVWSRGRAILQTSQQGDNSDHDKNQ